MTASLNTEKLGKIVQLAKLGIGGEREVAIRLVRKLCWEHGLSFDDVMNEQQIREFSMKYRNKEEERVLVQAILRYATLTDKHEIFENKLRKRIFFNTTQEKYIETVNAFIVLIRLYRKEKKKIMEATFRAFLEKHNLYYQPTPEEAAKREQKEISKEELEILRIANDLTGKMEDARIYKVLANKN